MGRPLADIAVRFRVTGRVQGVWFRGWTQEQAQARGLRGWVRNREDGSVEGVISGPEELAAEMISTLRQGPPAARVKGVDWTEIPTYDGEGFEIRR